MPHVEHSAPAASQETSAPALERARPEERMMLTSRELLGERREVRIAHEGSEYVLRATRNGKLILTK